MIYRQLTKNKSAYHHGNLKESLVVTAFEIVDKEGLEVLTLRELAVRLGTSRSAVYRHFNSKETLIISVIEKGYEHLDLLLMSIFQNKTHSVVKRFEMMCKAYLDFAIKHPNLYRLLFNENFRHEHVEICEYKDENLATGLYALIGLLLEAQKEEIVVRENPMIQLTIIWASIHGFASFLINEHLIMSDNQEAIFEYVQSTLLKGLKY